MSECGCGSGSIRSGVAAAGLSRLGRIEEDSGNNNLIDKDKEAWCKREVNRERRNETH